MEYYFNNNQRRQELFEQELSEMKNDQEQIAQRVKEQKLKQSNKDRFTTRKMSYYNTKKRALKKQDQIDEYMLISSPNKRRRL